MDYILAISAGLINPKKDYSIISKRNQYLNYALLGLATILKKNNYNIIQFQGEYTEPEDFIHYIENQGGISFNQVKFPILLSITSYLSIPWCIEFCKILKTNYDVLIYVGGKYVVGDDINWLKNKLRYVDMVFKGDVDNIISHVISLNCNKLNNFDSEINDTTLFSSLDFSILDKYINYQPCIEITRGCGYGCKFCASSNMKATGNKLPKLIKNEIKYIESLYNSREFNLYFQSSTFNVDNDWITGLNKVFNDIGYIIYWRCTTRVDTLSIDAIGPLARGGMKVLDLGLESASHRQLLSMNKTANPQKYLEKAERILYECKKYDVWVKLNILFTAGESFYTINETDKWLEKNSSYIKGVSVNSEIIYGYDNHVMDTYIKYGSSYAGNSSIIDDGYAYINLSKEVSYETIKNISIEISKKYMDSKDYYELKKYFYFPRNYTYFDFQSDLMKVNPSMLPFSV